MKKVFFAIAVLFYIYNTAFAAQNSDLSEVTNILETYKKSIDVTSYTVAAKCMPPPMDRLDISNENLVNSYKSFASTFEKVWGKASKGVNLDLLKKHPLSNLSNYKYKNISIKGLVAKADVELTTNGNKSEYVQHLAKINGKWYIVQKNGPPEYSDNDKVKINNLAKLIQKQADFVNNLTKKILDGTITQEKCLEMVRESIVEFMKKTNEITKS